MLHTASSFCCYIRFIASRGLGLSANGTILDIDQQLDDLIYKYKLGLSQHKLRQCTSHLYITGDVIWPTYAMFLAANREEYWHALQNRSMFVTDVWDYVPGTRDRCICDLCGAMRVVDGH